jgi:integrase
MPKGANGPAILKVGDVLAMMQPSFWQTDDLTAFRYCALVALLACCHIQQGHARGILLENWRYEGRDVVRIWRHHAWQVVHLTPQAIFAVERLLAERARVQAQYGWQSDFLFVTRNGTPSHTNDFTNGFKRLRERIGAGSTIPRMLKNFCVRQLRTGNDEVASRRYRGLGKPLGDKHNFLPPIPEARIERLVRCTNPFKSLDRQVRDEDAAQRWLADKALVVKFDMTAKTMPVDEPLVSELLKIDWPRGRHACRVLRSQLWEQHGDEIDRLLRERILTARLVARLLHCGVRAVQSFIHFHYRAGNERPVQRFKKPKPPKPRLTDADRATIAALKAALPSDTNARVAAVRDRLIAHFPTVDDMMSRGVLTLAPVAQLLGLQQNDILLFRAAAREGMPVEMLYDRQRVGKIPAQWWDEVRKAHLTRPAGDTDMAFFCRMFAAGFPGAWQTFSAFCRLQLRAKPAVELTQEERARLAALRALKWSTDPKILRAQRADVMRCHFADIDPLIEAGKLGVCEAADLFNCTLQRLKFFREARKAGLTVEQALAPPAPVSKETWAVVRREHALSPQEPELPFYFRMRRDHGFTGGEKLMRTFRQNLSGGYRAPQPVVGAAAAA